MIVHLFQFDIAWENKSQNISILEKELEQLAPNNSIIILPETFTTGFSMNTTSLAESMNDNSVSWMKSVSQKYNCLIAGTLIIEQNGKFFNRFVWAFPDGAVQFYDKHHLFRMGGENQSFSNGETRKIIEWQGIRICPLICYDLRFPVWSRNQNDYDLLVYSANWPAPRANVWKTLLSARAIENQCYVVGVNRCGTDGNNVAYEGNSMVVNFKGEIIKMSLESKPEIISVVLNFEEQKAFRESFPAWMDADKFTLELKQTFKHP